MRNKSPTLLVLVAILAFFLITTACGCSAPSDVDQDITSVDQLASFDASQVLIADVSDLPPPTMAVLWSISSSFDNFDNCVCLIDVIPTAVVSGQLANYAFFYAATTEANFHFTISHYYLNDDLNAANLWSLCLVTSDKVFIYRQAQAAISGNVQDNNRYEVINRRHQTSMSMTNKFV